MQNLATNPCPACEVNLEFPLELAGTTIACPKCGAEVALGIPASTNTFDPAEQSPPDSADPGFIPPEPLSVATSLRGFQGEMKRHATPFLYQIGLLLVAITI